VFLLVDESTVKKYKADLSDEIEPQITELISRAEKGLEALQKKRLLLQTKVPPIVTYRGAICAKCLESGQDGSVTTFDVRWGKPSITIAHKATTTTRSTS
jgi:hypothetical protein